MTPKLAPEARYRVIPHPSPASNGGCGIVADETGPLNSDRVAALTDWLAGPLYPVVPTGDTTNDYADSIYAEDQYEDAPLYNAGGVYRALAPHLAALLAMPMVATVVGGGPDRTRIFGLTADWTVCVVVATLNPDYLTEESAE